MPTRKEIDAENSRLRAEVEKLQAILYPPPPEPEPEETKPRGCILSLARLARPGCGARGNVEWSDEPNFGVAQYFLSMVRKREPDVEWVLVYRVEDLPEGELTLLGHDLLAATFAKEDEPWLLQVRWWRRITLDGKAK